MRITPLYTRISSHRMLSSYSEQDRETENAIYRTQRSNQHTLLLSPPLRSLMLQAEAGDGLCLGHA